jgi:hypothetical protein
VGCSNIGQFALCISDPVQRVYARLRTVPAALAPAGASVTWWLDFANGRSVAVPVPPEPSISQFVRVGLD